MLKDIDNAQWYIRHNDIHGDFNNDIVVGDHVNNKERDGNQDNICSWTTQT